jgi:CheY-like chemotaxis protein
VVNARDAISEQGCITIETSNVQVSESQFPNLAAGMYRCIQVSDNGSGIPVAHRDRIFEPFFTTKQQGKGTGLGLASVYGIVNQCGGHIAFKTEVGHGTTFRVYIPAVDATVERDIAFKDLQLNLGSETVLLVEDEAAVRSLSRHILETCGYTVFEAGNGEEAIDIALHHADEIDIIVTDVVMPIMGARIMLEKLRPMIREMKVLLLSGYGEENLCKDILEYSQASFLHKPFTVASLALAVRRVLDGEIVA